MSAGFVRRDPLGFCDGRTVDPEDLVPLQRLYLDGRQGENVVVKARREEKGVHDWYWISGQTVNEVVMLKLFDSEERQGRCTQTPHASFSLEGMEEVLEPGRVWRLGSSSAFRDAAPKRIG